jgi:organic hydroperoxide reductase OsmC/OhrA/CheY-like chemotaxis protein
MNGRILIVEDSASIALTCRLHLDGQGHTLMEAADGQTALNALRAGPVDCILLDLDLPDMNGIEILRIVRDGPNPPAVVVVTAPSSVQQAEYAVGHGAFDYLVKPFSGGRLVTTVRNALAQADMQRELAKRLVPLPQLRTHRYTAQITWTGNRGTGTSDYRAYGRDHVIQAPGQPPIIGTSDPLFRGDKGHWNPEQLLVAALTSCHQLWYLHLCAEAGVVVVAYADEAVGRMVEETDGSGQFSDVTLNPVVTISAASNATLAMTLHMAAHEKCFLANSVNFPVHCKPVVRSET